MELGTAFGNCRQLAPSWPRILCQGLSTITSKLQIPCFILWLVVKRSWMLQITAGLARTSRELEAFGPGYGGHMWPNTRLHDLDSPKLSDGAIRATLLAWSIPWTCVSILPLPLLPEGELYHNHPEKGHIWLLPRADGKRHLGLRVNPSQTAVSQATKPGALV